MMMMIENNPEEITQQCAFQGIEVLRHLIHYYSQLMHCHASRLDPEQLFEILPLNPAQKIKEDSENLHVLVEALEFMVKNEEGFTLSRSLEVLQEFGGEFMEVLIDYLKKSGFPVFRAMLDVISCH